MQSISDRVFLWRRGSRCARARLSPREINPMKPPDPRSCQTFLRIGNHYTACQCAACPIPDAIVLIAAGFLVIRWYGSEERALVKGMLNLAEEVKERQALWETASGNAPEDPFGAMKMTTVFNVSSEELPVTLGVDTVFLRDAKARRLRADTEISVMNNKLAGVSLIGLDHTLIVTIPVFFRQNLELDTQRIDRQYNDSLFAAENLPQSGQLRILQRSILRTFFFRAFYHLSLFQESESPQTAPYQTSSLCDLVCKEDIKRYLQIYLEKKGTVVITTHEESELSLCDRLYVMKDGRLFPVDRELRGTALTVQF